MSRIVVLLAALGASVFVVGTSEYLVSGLLPQVASDLGVSVAAAGQAVTAYALGVVLGGPLLTAATVRVPRRVLAVALLVLFALGNGLCAVAPSYGVLIAGRVVASLSHAAFLTLALMLTTRIVRPDRVGSAIAGVAAGFSVATLLGVPVGVLLGESAGWRTPFALLAGLALVMAVTLGVLLPGGETGATRVRDEVRTVVSRPVLLVVATTAVGMAAVSTVFTYLAPSLRDVAGFGAAAVSGLLVIYGVGSLAGGLVAGRLADRSLEWTVRGTFGGLAVVLVVVALALPWKVGAVAAVLAFGLLASSTTPTLQTLLLKHAGSAPTLAVSVNIAAFNIGIALGSVVGGVVVSGVGTRWTGLVGAVLSVAGLGLSYLALPRPGVRHQDVGHRSAEVGVSR
ncbi:MFS transporter [Actinomadura logoneensis]|uniref:MFS transporter n=1 Tax=Actinomadura logoneensis TaxID=2293572 RepID=A0A372JHI2_9ACTN|nr:MFS transporter [Actinomadura logoneensis]RFU39461.1 MFS transporter [Actinomadura logoneensis]